MGGKASPRTNGTPSGRRTRSALLEPDAMLVDGRDGSGEAVENGDEAVKSEIEAERTKVDGGNGPGGDDDGLEGNTGSREADGAESVEGDDVAMVG